ncbi:hypothetical protein SOPP22_00620 [Shewanella sp. OPT22]|nr:hypothetical protein SOPP22_00620 [Shewanella sp. OPT22]
MPYSFSKKAALAASIVGTLLLTGCPDNDKKSTPDQPEPPAPTPVVTFDYKVTVTNLTPEQPLSPIAVVLHNSDTPLFVAGETASDALELLAEAGDNSGLETAEGVTDFFSAEAPTGPGQREVIDITLNEDQLNNVSVLSMLVNTNDAFTGVSNFNLSSLESGQKVTFRANVYDSGTEANTEAKGTIPGPADQGQGFDAVRDDVDRVYIHSGVISKEDGLADSVLFAKHRFDNPAMTVVIERTN